jgi:hypothetical protein
MLGSVGFFPDPKISKGSLRKAIVTLTNDKAGSRDHPRPAMPAVERGRLPPREADDVTGRSHRRRYRGRRDHRRLLVHRCQGRDIEP